MEGRWETCRYRAEVGAPFLRNDCEERGGVGRGGGKAGRPTKGFSAPGQVTGDGGLDLSVSKGGRERGLTLDFESQIQNHIINDLSKVYVITSCYFIRIASNYQIN